jgi:hypothetical protein
MLLGTVRPDLSPHSRTKLPWVLLYALFIFYAGTFIYQSSFVIDGQRYFCLFDDAMVSMRYARNLVGGLGLVWNPGEEKVEGFTTPFWTVYMAVPHLLGLGPSKTSLFIQISGLMCLLLNLVAIRAVARIAGCGDSHTIFASLLFVAFFYPLNNWSLLGMEVGLLALVTSTATFLSLKVLETAAARFSLYVLLAAATLVRIDASVVGFAIVIFLAVVQRRLRLLHLVAGLGSIVGVLAIQTLLRWVYYGDLLPNTYYLKMVGYPSYDRIHWGLAVFLMRLSQLNWALCLFPLVLIVVQRTKALGLMAAVVLAQVAYGIYVGGDAWEGLGANRYLTVVAPVFFVLFALAASRTLRWVADLARRPGVFRYAFSVFVALSLVRFNMNSGLASLAPVFLQAPSPLASRNPEMVRLALILTQVTKRDASIAVVWAGIIPYFSGRHCVDLLGKNDRTIAHQEMHQNAAMGFWPGHLKWDYRFSIEGRRPDVVAQVWADPASAKRSLSGGYLTAGAFGSFFCARRSSPRIEWDKVATLDCGYSYLLCPPPL